MNSKRFHSIQRNIFYDPIVYSVIHYKECISKIPHVRTLPDCTCTKLELTLYRVKWKIDSFIFMYYRLIELHTSVNCLTISLNEIHFMRNIATFYIESMFIFVLFWRHKKKHAAKVVAVDCLSANPRAKNT